MSGANLPNLRICSHMRSGAGATKAGVTGCPFLDMADSTSVRSAALESLTAFATGLAYFSCFSCIRQIQSKIAGRASTRDRRGDHEMRTHLWFAKGLCLTLKGFLSYLGRSAHLVVSGQ